MNVINNVSQQNTVIIDGSRFTDQKAAEKPLDLKPGSTIQGTVVSVSESEGGERIATINVGDNVINAKLSDEMGLREGQTLNFSVRSNGASGVTITPLYENTSIDQSTLKALTAAGIEINNDTVQMVKDMMEAGLPIGKDALLEMNKNLSANPNTSISTMVEMKSLGIPINENNIVQYESYKSYEHQVTSAMEDIMNELLDDVSVEDRMPVRYYCNCSIERVTKALISLGNKELQAMIDDGEPVRLHCDFCEKDYEFTIEELKKLIGS